MTHPAPSDEERHKEVAPGPRARILVVDDEPYILAAVGRLLRDRSVETADSAKAALARFDAGERFDVILCDVRMPEMTGTELLDELSARHPDIAARVILMSGAPPVGARYRERPLIDKPFTVSVLRGAIETVLRENEDREAPSEARPRDPFGSNA